MSYLRWFPTTSMSRLKPSCVWCSSRAKLRVCFAIPPGPNRSLRICAALRPKLKSAASKRRLSQARRWRHRPGLTEFHAVGIDHLNADLVLDRRHIAEMEAGILAERDVAVDGHHCLVAIAHGDALNKMGRNVVAGNLVELHA